MARKLILLVLFFVIFMKIFALAGPANPHPMEFTQDDGSVIRLFLRGDEFFSWWEDARGYIVPGDGKTRADALLPQIQRAWRFNPANPAPKANDAPVIAPKMPAVPHIVLPPGTILPSPTFEPPPPIRQTPLRDPIIIGMGGIAEPRPPVLTEQKLLLVLLEFNDMSLLNSDEFFYDKYFNSDPDAISVANYFRDMSGGREIFVPAGIRRVRLDMPHPIADWQNSPNGHEAARAALMQALAAIRNTGFDFTGVHIAAIFAGGEASDNSNPGGQIWAHTWNFSGADIGVAGRPRYIAYGEQQRGGIATGVGIAAHELGHILGLPDLYDITGQTQGLGPYSLMAYGSWGKIPENPAHSHNPTALDAWSLLQLGYKNPITVSTFDWNGNIENKIVKVAPTVADLRYFLIESRQLSNRWDAGLYGWFRGSPVRGGLAVYHVDDHKKTIDLQEADDSDFLSQATVNWEYFQNHFFTYYGFNRFNYHPLGVNIKIHAANELKIRLGPPAPPRNSRPPIPRVFPMERT